MQAKVDAVYAQRGLLDGSDGSSLAQQRPAAAMPSRPPSQHLTGLESLSAAFSFDAATASFVQRTTPIHPGLSVRLLQLQQLFDWPATALSLYKIMAFEGSEGEGGPLMDSTQVGRKLRSMLTLEDLTEVEPSLAAGLRTLLEWEENNISGCLEPLSRQVRTLCSPTGRSLAVRRSWSCVRGNDVAVDKATDMTTCIGS